MSKPHIRLLTIDDLEIYVQQCAAESSESGCEGDPYFGPYSRFEEFPLDEFRRRTEARWAKTLDTPGWRRAWGVFVDDRIVGSGNVAAGDLPADLHRVNLGIGILRPHRRRGLGRRLMASIFDWCRKQPSVAWLDLGVFSDNEPAIALYEHLGFTTIGRVTDRWRVDGRRIDEIRMTCRVGDGEPA